MGRSPAALRRTIGRIWEKIDEVLRVNLGQGLGRQLADQETHRTGRGLPGINPAAKRRHHGWDIGGGLAVPCDLVHAHPPGG
jgi:hypothetical protein